MQGEGLLRLWRGGYAPSPWVSSLCFGHMLRHCSECRTCDSVSRSKQLAHMRSVRIRALRHFSNMHQYANWPVHQCKLQQLHWGGGRRQSSWGLFTFAISAACETACMHVTNSVSAATCLIEMYHCRPNLDAVLCYMVSQCILATHALCMIFGDSQTSKVCELPTKIWKCGV